MGDSDVYCCAGCGFCCCCYYRYCCCYTDCCCFEDRGNLPSKLQWVFERTKIAVAGHSHCCCTRYHCCMNWCYYSFSYCSCCSGFGNGEKMQPAPLGFLEPCLFGVFGFGWTYYLPKMVPIADHDGYWRRLRAPSQKLAKPDGIVVGHSSVLVLLLMPHLRECLP